MDRQLLFINDNLIGANEVYLGKCVKDKAELQVNLFDSESQSQFFEHLSSNKRKIDDHVHEGTSKKVTMIINL